MKETKDPFLHGELGLPCRKRAIVLHCTQRETRLSDTQNDFWIRFRFTTGWLANFQPGVSTQKGPKRVWKLLPSVSGSSIKNGRSSLSWSTLIVFLRNELDTWAIAFLAKPSSTPNRSFEKIGTGCLWRCCRLCVVSVATSFELSHPVVQGKRIQKSFWESLSRVSRWVQWSTIARFLQWRG